MVKITDTGFQEITGPSCNQYRPLQAVITGLICNSELQEEPVISSNQAAVIAPLDMNPVSDPGPSGPLCERIESNYVTPVLNPAAAIEELSWEERGERHEAQRRGILALISARSASCRSDVTPLFWTGVDVWRCDACRAVFSGRGD